jgi:PhnB protein
MELNTYLMFHGNCRQALEFYEQALGAHIESVFTYAGSPMDAATPPDWRDKIMHARVTIAGQIVMASDAPPDRQQKHGGFSMSISVTDTAEAERIFHALAAGGQTHMPLQETFWAKRFGMLVDRFGIPWMVNCEKPM